MFATNSPPTSKITTSIIINATNNISRTLHALRPSARSTNLIEWASTVVSNIACLCHLLPTQLPTTGPLKSAKLRIFPDAITPSLMLSTIATKQCKPTIPHISLIISTVLQPSVLWLQSKGAANATVNKFSCMTTSQPLCALNHQPLLISLLLCPLNPSWIRFALIKSIKPLLRATILTLISSTIMNTTTNVSNTESAIKLAQCNSVKNTSLLISE